MNGELGHFFDFQVEARCLSFEFHWHEEFHNRSKLQSHHAEIHIVLVHVQQSLGSDNRPQNLPLAVKKRAVVGEEGPEVNILLS